MSDRTRESSAITVGHSRILVALVGAVAVSLGVLLLASTAGGPGAVTTVGLLLAEAVVLSVGYGALVRLTGPAFTVVLERD